MAKSDKYANKRFQLGLKWGTAIASAPPVPLVSRQHVRVPFVGGEADALTRAEGVGET